ncbi:MAG: hypothetical protein KDM64_20230, partial [Verrucomicrobiae bacterium]|nr:hypothetical protein [Verrucomicrobiae bacterium]
MRLLLITLAACLGGMVSMRAADRPNVLWIMSEDNSTHYLKLYNENGATTPNIEALAAHGL